MKNSYKLIIGITLLIISACNSNQTDKSTEASSSEKPLNIVYIMADDHAYQAISAYGSAVSKLAPTPNIDRIANQGARMDAVFCLSLIHI